MSSCLDGVYLTRPHSELSLVLSSSHRVCGYKTPITTQRRHDSSITLAKKRESSGTKDMFASLEDAESPIKDPLDPAEIKIYLKQLKRALKFLPLGSRAYYYVSGEIVRAGRELQRTQSMTPSMRGTG